MLLKKINDTMDKTFINFLGKWDKSFLQSKFSQLEIDSEIEILWDNQISEAYEDYVTNFSNKSEPIRPEGIKNILRFCFLFKPKKLIDFGSGFSSYIFRLYKSKFNPSSVVFSVDDNKEWLSVTRDFLKKYECDSENLFLFSNFIKKVDSKFDLILNDFSSRWPVRQISMKLCYNLISENGVLLLDDFNKSVKFIQSHQARDLFSKAFLKYIRYNHFLNSTSLKFLSLREFSLDTDSGYQALIFRKENTLLGDLKISKDAY